MKHVLAVVLIILLVMVALPVGMGGMGDCPMCTSPKTVALGICAAILSLIILTVPLCSSRLRLLEELSRRFLLGRSVYRPPRFA